MAARALVREARSQFFPTATVGANYSRSRGSANLGNNVGATGTTSGKGSTGLIDLPFDVSWDARPVGQSPQYHSPGAIFRASQRRRSRK